MVTVTGIIQQLQMLANPDNLAGMRRYGINTHNTLGISIHVLRPLAKEIGRDHGLALELWESGIHEARILASFIADPLQLTEAQMERWAADFDSWDVCDQVCGFFELTPLAWQKVYEWSSRPEEFVKRATFAIMAGLVMHEKNTPDEPFELFLPVIVGECTDERNYVKKAVNWALRNIGKRSRRLNDAAIRTARQIAQIDARTARWIAADALRELTSEKVQVAISKRENHARI